MGKTIIEGNKVVQEDNGVDEEKRAARDERIAKARLNSARRDDRNATARAMLRKISTMKPGDPITQDMITKAQKAGDRTPGKPDPLS